MPNPLSPVQDERCLPRSSPSTTPRRWISSTPSPTTSVYSSFARSKPSTPSLRSVGSATTSSSESPSSLAPWTPPLLPDNFSHLIHTAKTRTPSTSVMSVRVASMSGSSDGQGSVREGRKSTDSPSSSSGHRQGSSPLHQTDEVHARGYATVSLEGSEGQQAQVGSVEGPGTPKSSYSHLPPSPRLSPASSYFTSSPPRSPGPAPSPASYFPSSPRSQHLSPTTPRTPVSVPFPSSPRSPSSPSPSLLPPSQTSTSLYRPRRSSKRLLSASPTVETLTSARIPQHASTPPHAARGSASMETPKSARSNRSMSSASSAASFRTAFEDPVPPVPAFPPWTPPIQHGSPMLSPTSQHSQGGIRDSMISRFSSYTDAQEFMDDEGQTSDDATDHDRGYPFASSSSGYRSSPGQRRNKSPSASTSTLTLYPASSDPSQSRPSQTISSPPHTPKASASKIPPVPTLPSFASGLLSPKERSVLLQANSYFLPPVCSRPSELELSKISAESVQRAKQEMKPSASMRAKGLLRGAKSAGNLNSSVSRQTLRVEADDRASGTGRGRTISSGPSAGGVGTLGSRASGLASWFIGGGGGEKGKGEDRPAVPRWEDGATLDPVEDDLVTTRRKERKRDFRQRSVRLENFDVSQFAPDGPVEPLPGSRTTRGLDLSAPRPLDAVTSSPSTKFPPLVLQKPAHRRRTSSPKIEKHKELWRADLLTQANGFSLTLSPPIDAGMNGAGTFLPSPPLALSTPPRDGTWSSMKKSMSGRLMSPPPARAATGGSLSKGDRPPLPTTPEIRDRQALPTMRKSLAVPLHSDDLQDSDDGRTSSVYSISWKHSTTPRPVQSETLPPVVPPPEQRTIQPSTSSELPYYASPPGDFDPSGFEQPYDDDARLSMATNSSAQGPEEVLISGESCSSVASEYSSQDYASDSDNGMLGVAGLGAGVGLGLEIRQLGSDRGTLGQRSRQPSWGGSDIAEQTEGSSAGGEESDSSELTHVDGFASRKVYPVSSLKQIHRPPALNLNPWGTSPPGVQHHLPTLAASPTSLHPRSPISSSSDVTDPRDHRRSFLGDLSVLPSPLYSTANASHGSYSSYQHHPGDVNLLRSPPVSPYLSLSPTPRSTSGSGSLSPVPSVYSLPRSPYLRQRPPLPFGAASNPDLPLTTGSPSSPYLPSSPLEGPSTVHSRSQTNLPSMASTASFFDNLDPTLPITNTLPPLPRSASASIKQFFSRSPKPHHTQPQQAVPAIPKLPRSKSKTGTFVPIPASAFDLAPLVPASTVPQASVMAGVGKSGGARIEAWRSAQQTAADPGVTRLEGMLEMHVELEKERMKRIKVASAGGGVGEAPVARRGR